MAECEHNNITIVTRYYPGNFYEPPETELLHCQCDDCDETIDWDERAPDAKVTEVDWRDWR